MKKTNNIWENTSKFLTIIIISLIFVGCSTTGDTGGDAGGDTGGDAGGDTGGDTGGNNDGVYTSAWDGTASEEPSKGENLYIITEAKHLAWLAEQDTAITTAIRFDANIDMGSKIFTGIKEFSGVMDGNNKKIKNLKIEDGGNTGLILLVPSGTIAEIKNLTIESGSIKGSMAGAFIAESYGAVTLTGLINKATVSGDNTGGMIGIANDKVTINNTQNTGAINGGSVNSTAGGMIGQAMDNTVTIKNAKNTGTISSGDKSGGMLGWATSTSTVNINNANNTGTISGGARAGGMMGYSEGEVTINNANNTGAIKGDNTGGMIGNSEGEVTINNAENTAMISSKHRSGGMIGFANGKVTIDNTANTGTITSDRDAGGMLGLTQNEVTIKNSHSYQAQKLVGTGTPTPTITASYYLDDTATVGEVDDKLTTAEFRTQASFTGWYFGTIWKMDLVKGYPVLQHFNN